MWSVFDGYELSICFIQSFGYSRVAWIYVETWRIDGFMVIWVIWLFGRLERKLGDDLVSICRNVEVAALGEMSLQAQEDLDRECELSIMTTTKTINVRFMTEYIEIGPPRYPQV